MPPGPPPGQWNLDVNLAPLTVRASFRTPLGIPVELPVGVLRGGAEWKPTPPLPVVGNLLARQARFRLQAAPGR